MKKLTTACAAILALAACVGQPMSTRTTMNLAEAEELAKADGRELTDTERRGFEIVCTEEKITGSRSRVNRTCLTRNQWRDIQTQTKNTVGGMQGNASGGKECIVDAMGGCS